MIGNRFGSDGDTGFKMGIDMMLDIIQKTRTVRKFQEGVKISRKTLLELLDLARLGGSARNSQPLCYMLITDKEQCENIFPLLGWAGYLNDWPGPKSGERPVAYILCLLDTIRCKGPENEAHFDLGIASQNILLGAAERGIFGCRIGAFSKAAVGRSFSLKDRYKPLLVLALGYPAEEVVIEKMGQDGDICYWRDADGVHHVPKRLLSDIVLDPGS